MRAVDIIEKKRDNKELSEAELEFILNGYLNEDIPDYQISSFMMAIYFNGLTDNELMIFTKIMMNSGDLIKFPDIDRFLIDKHSTGGVGDKTTIALAPILAVLGIGTAKLSGRGLGHTGGTIDKFESIKGFKFAENREQLVELVNKTGIGIMGYSDKIVPLDKKLYSLRDVTATVPSIPMISASIMSKKLAVFSDGIILDVKTGSGAFMKTLGDSRALAKTMKKIGEALNRKVVTVISDMDQPLGNAVGNSLEIIEAIETLKGNGPKDFTDLVIELAAIANMLKSDISLDNSREEVKTLIGSKELLDSLKEFISACGGNGEVVYDYNQFTTAKYKKEVIIDKKGYVHKIVADEIGRAAMIMGAGRATKEDIIDHSVGIVLKKKVADMVDNESIAIIYYNDESKIDDAVNMVLNAYLISANEIDRPKTIIEIDY